MGRLGRFAAQGAAENRELGSIISTAITHCGFIGIDFIATSLRAAGPQLRFADLRKRRTTVYLILPMDYFATCGKWFRLLIASAVADLLQHKHGPVPVLFQLDEFPIVGSLKVLADLMGIGRGYGIQLWPILQDLNQLIDLYPKRWQTFLANSQAQIFLRSNDATTAKYVSEQCGVMQQRYETESVSSGLWSPQGDAAQNVSVSTNYGRELRPLLYPHEVSTIGEREMLVFGKGVGVIRAGRRSYLEMPECRGKYGPHPQHDAPSKRKR
jgi:type IV secretion system protein VirD4